MTRTLDEIMSGRDEAVPASAPTPEPAPQPEPDPAPQPDPQPEPEATDHDQQMVPVGALKGEREKVRRYTEEVADFRKRLDDVPTQIATAVQQAFAQLVPHLQRPQQAPQPPQPPDLFEDPNGFVRHAMEPLAQQQQAMVEHVSRMLAVREHGQELVDQAYQAIAQRLRTDPQMQWEYQRIMQSGDPWGSLVDWHKRDAALQRYGTDPEAYINAEVERRLAQRAQQQPNPAPAAPAPTVMPSNFAQARSAGPRGGATWSGPRPLSDIMKR